MKSSTKNILTVIASAFCLIALFDGLPYGYFTLLRFVVFAISTYLAYIIYESHKESLWIWAFGFIAVLFNPFIIITLQRSQWTIIDLLVGVFFIVSMFTLKIKDN